MSYPGFVIFVVKSSRKCSYAVGVVTCVIAAKNVKHKRGKSTRFIAFKSISIYHQIMIPNVVTVVNDHDENEFLMVSAWKKLDEASK